MTRHHVWTRNLTDAAWTRRTSTAGLPAMEAEGYASQLAALTDLTLSLPVGDAPPHPPQTAVNITTPPQLWLTNQRQTLCTMHLADAARQSPTVEMAWALKPTTNAKALAHCEACTHSAPTLEDLATQLDSLADLLPELRKLLTADRLLELLNNPNNEED